MPVDLHIYVILLAVAALAAQVSIAVHRLEQLNDRRSRQVEICKLVIDDTERLRIPRNLCFGFANGLIFCHERRNTCLVDVEPFDTCRGVGVVHTRRLFERCEQFGMHLLVKIELALVFEDFHVGIANHAAEESLG